MRIYSIRVPDGAMAAATTGQMRACLRQFFIDGNPSRIAPDPGAGDVVIRRSLDERLVSKFSAALGASPGVALRRLAVTCVRALPSGGSVAPALPSRSLVNGPGLPASQTAAIAPWRAFWDKAWPWVLISEVVVIVGLATGGLSFGSGAAADQTFPDWRPE